MSAHANFDLTINGLCTGVLIMFAHMIQWFNDLRGVHLPPIIIECLQALSYFGAFVVSCYAVYSHILKLRKSKKHD